MLGCILQDCLLVRLCSRPIMIMVKVPNMKIQISSPFLEWRRPAFVVTQSTYQRGICHLHSLLLLIFCSLIFSGFRNWALTFISIIASHLAIIKEGVTFFFPTRVGGILWGFHFDLARFQEHMLFHASHMDYHCVAMIKCCLPLPKNSHTFYTN